MLSPDDVVRLARFSADHAQDGLLWLDAKGRVHYANQSAVRLIGTPADAIIGKTIFQIAPEFNEDLWRELWKELRAQGLFSFEFTLQNHEKNRVQVDMTVHRFEIASRDFACVYFRDIEERQRLKTLEQEFVSTVSHELRTPLTVVREGVSQVIDGLHGEINAPQERVLAIALTGIDRLARMIGDLLDLSKIESGKVNLRRDRLDLSLLVREVAASFQTMARERGIELRVTTPAGPAVLFADRDRLIQVLTNLINNAFKFTEKGRIEVVVSATPDTVSCAVEDTGVGLSTEDLEKIFSKFEQLERTSVTGERGTGLGLSICKAIVELQKGRIWGESAGAGRGSRFVFELPSQKAVDVFREQLTVLLAEVAMRGGSLSVVTYEVRSMTQDPVPETDILAMVESLENLARQHRGRQTDLFVKNVDVVYWALPSTVRKEAERVAAQIQKAFQEALARERCGRRLAVRYSVTSFPDDESDEQRFLQKALPEQAA